MAPLPESSLGKMKPRFDLGDTRFYQQRFPEKDELVMVKVKRIAEMGAYVSLLEYNGLEGMILMSELSKRRIRSVKKIVRVGRHEVVLVLRVDQEKGYIDLSKKRVSPEDVVRCEERFSKSKKVHQIMCHVAQKHEICVDQLNMAITWPLQKLYGHALDAFKDPEFVTSIVHTLNIPDEVKASLIEDVKLRLASHTMRMRVRVDLRCSGPAGVEAVRAALLKGKEVAAAGDPDADVKLKLIAPPSYTLITACADKADGEKRLKAAIQAMIATIRQHAGGNGHHDGEFLIIGGEEEKPADEQQDESDSSDDTSSEESEEEDEGMGRIEDLELPPDQIEDDDDDDDDDDDAGSSGAQPKPSSATEAKNCDRS